MDTLNPDSLIGVMVNILREYDSPMTISAFSEQLTEINSRRLVKENKRKNDTSSIKWTYEEVQEAFSALCCRDSNFPVWIATLPSDRTGAYLILIKKPRASR